MYTLRDIERGYGIKYTDLRQDILDGKLRATKNQDRYNRYEVSEEDLQAYLGGKTKGAGNHMVTIDDQREPREEQAVVEMGDYFLVNGRLRKVAKVDGPDGVELVLIDLDSGNRWSHTFKQGLTVDEVMRDQFRLQKTVRSAEYLPSDSVKLTATIR